MRICSIDGCNRRLYSSGLCHGHLLRMRRYANPLSGTPLKEPGRREDPYVRFMRFVHKLANGCWLWTGRTDASGRYGAFNPESKKTCRAHRWIYEHEIGPIPDGLVIDHLCRNPKCVNPAHLEPVTNRENVLRGVAPSAVNAIATHCKHGHEFTSENTYIRPDGNRSCRTCNAASSREYRRRMQMNESSAASANTSALIRRLHPRDAAREAAFGASVEDELRQVGPEPSDLEGGGDV